MGAFTEYCKRRKVTAMDNKVREESKNKDQYQKDNPNQRIDSSKHKKVYVNSSLGRSIVGGSKKKTTELPAMSKRQKMDTDSQA